MNLDHDYWALKEKVVDTEQKLLRIIGFELELVHPYRYVLHLGQFAHTQS